MSFFDATPAGARQRVRPMQFCSPLQDRCGALGIVELQALEHPKGRDVMAEALQRFWFAAAVFREPHDLVSTIAALRDKGFAGNRLLVIANHRAADMRKTVLNADVGSVPVVAMPTDGAGGAAAPAELPAGLRTLLAAIDAVDGAAQHGAAAADRGRQSQVYAQLRQDVADGAVVLVASVANPDEQLLGARILLRGNSECVLTHEIAEPCA
jgi:hypothetical protein